MARDDVELREERERLQREQHAADLKAVLELPQGRRFISETIFETCGLQRMGFAGDPRQHAYYDGQRRIGMELDAAAKLADKRLWALMHQERITRLGDELDEDSGNKSDQ